MKAMFVSVGVGVLCAMNASGVWINEIHYDNDGSDVGEGVEVAGAAGTDLTGWQLLLYNGSNGSVYNTVNLTGAIGDEGGGFGALAFAISGIQNGAPDGVALVDSGGTLLEFLSYEGTFTGTAGAANGVTSVDIGVSEPTSTAIGMSLQLVGDYASGFSWSGPSDDSFGFLNTGQIFPNEEPPPLPEKPATVPDGGTTAVLLFGGLTALSLLQRRSKMP